MKKINRVKRFRRERVRADGTVVAILRELMPDGGYVTTYTDITERKKMEASLRETEERFRKAFQDTSVGMTMRNVNDRTLVTNEAFCKMLGYSHEELEQMYFNDLIHPHHVPWNHRP